MAGSLTDYTEDKILDHLLGGTAFTQPTNRYIGLYTANPSDDGTGGTEVSGFAYARVIENGWSNDGAGQRSNSGVVTFPAASGGNWGTILGFGLFDALSGGNLLAYADLAVSKVVNDGDQASFAIGALQITLD